MTLLCDSVPLLCDCVTLLCDFVTLLCDCVTLLCDYVVVPDGPHLLSILDRLSGYGETEIKGVSLTLLYI